MVKQITKTTTINFNFSHLQRNLGYLKSCTHHLIQIQRDFRPIFDCQHCNKLVSLIFDTIFNTILSHDSSSATKGLLIYYSFSCFPTFEYTAQSEKWLLGYNEVYSCFESPVLKPTSTMQSRRSSEQWILILYHCAYGNDYDG